MAQINASKRCSSHAKPHAIEFISLNHRRMADIHRVGSTMVGRKIVSQRQTAGGQASKGSTLRENILPKLLGRTGIRETTCHPDDSYRRSHTVLGTLAAVETRAKRSTIIAATIGMVTTEL